MYGIIYYPVIYSGDSSLELDPVDDLEDAKFTLIRALHGPLGMKADSFSIFEKCVPCAGMGVNRSGFGPFKKYSHCPVCQGKGRREIC